MAKSKRSKVKRRFRAVKRHNVKPKAVELLKKVLNLPAGGTGLPYVDASKSAVVEVGQVEVMKSATKNRKVSLMNEHGNYPIWMNKKEMKRQKRKRKLIARQKKKVSRN